jgi:hypothetical protein
MKYRLRRCSGVFLTNLIVALAVNLSAQTQASPKASDLSRIVGTIKSAQADSLVLTSDAGGEVKAALGSSTKILRVPSGEKDLKNATPMQAQDLQPGDRVLLRGQPSADNQSLTALSVIVMKQADVSAKQEREREDWQKRGVAGLVTAADASVGNITISSAGLGGNHNVVIHTSKTTATRRYAPDSIKFDDARPAALEQVKVGDQLRARGTRNGDESELTADEIVFGTFRNIAGTISSIDAASNSMVVADVIGKDSVTVKISPGSQLKKLPPEMAQRIALRLRGGAGEAAGQSAIPGQSAATQSPDTPRNASRAGGKAWSRGPGGAGQSGGPPDLQRFLSRLPDSELTDLSQGDAVMIVSTQGEIPHTVTAITVLGGVEPILTASPNRGAAMLSPWTLGGAGGEGESAP